MTDTNDPNTNERRKRLRSRNIAVLAVLIGFAVIVYFVTIVKIKLSHGL